MFKSQAKAGCILHIGAQTTTDQDGLDDGLVIVKKKNNKCVPT